MVDLVSETLGDRRRVRHALLIIVVLFACLVLSVTAILLVDPRMASVLGAAVGVRVASLLLG